MLRSPISGAPIAEGLNVEFENTFTGKYVPGVTKAFKMPNGAGIIAIAAGPQVPAVPGGPCPPDDCIIDQYGSLIDPASGLEWATQALPYAYTGPLIEPKAETPAPVDPAPLAIDPASLGASGRPTVITLPVVPPGGTLILSHDADGQLSAVATHPDGSKHESVGQRLHEVLAEIAEFFRKRL